MHIKYVATCTFLRCSITNSDISNRNIRKTIKSFYCKSNEVLSDFKHLTRVVKAQLLSSYCLDANASQLWPFYDKSVNLILLLGEELLGR